MADRKITDLTALAAGSQATGDLLTIVDVSEAAATDKNKKITVESLFKGIPGNVGIGTSAPAAKLEVLGSDDANNLVVSAGNTDFAVYNDDSAGEVRLVAEDGSASNNSKFLTLYTQASGAADASERMRIDSSGNVIVKSSTSNQQPAFRVESFGEYGEIKSDGTGALILEADPDFNAANSTIKLKIDGSEAMQIDSSGRVLVGTTSARSQQGIQSHIQSEHTDYSGLSLVVNNTADATCPVILMAKSKGSTKGSSTSVANGSRLGIISFQGADGTDIESAAANIQGEVDGTPGSNDMPGRLVFSTSADGAQVPTERMRITSSGNVGMGSTSPGAKLHIANTGGNADLVLQGSASGESIINFGDTADLDVGQILYNHTSNYMRFLTSTGERMRIDSSGNVGIGTTSIASGGASTTNFNVHTPSANSVYLKLSNSSTGNTASDAFDLSADSSGNAYLINRENARMTFYTNASERVRINANGGFLVATTNATPGLGDSDVGLSYEFPNGAFFVSRGDNNTCMFLNKNSGSGSGAYIDFNKSGSGVGSISHNGSGVISYNSFQGSHLGRLVDRSTPDIKVGTLIEVTGTPLDYKCVPFTYTDVDGETQKMRKPWTGTEAVGATVSFDWNGTTYSGVVTDENAENDYEKSLYTQVCATAASKAVLGVFMCWDDDTKRLYTDSYNDMMVTSVGNFVVRMASAQTPAIGDLFESDANGCAVVQTDDIIRSKTIGKITSTEKQVVYDDGSFLVTCILYSG